MGKSRPASSAAAVREKDVTRTDSGPYRSAARRIWRERLVVLPVPGGPKMRYSDVTLWSLCPISSSVPVACSLGIGFLLARRVLSGIKLIHRQHPPALLLELRAADTDALATKYSDHREGGSEPPVSRRERSKRTTDSKDSGAEEQRPKIWLVASGRQKRSAHCADRHDRRQQTESARIGMEDIHRHGGDEDREIQTECSDQKEHD